MKIQTHPAKCVASGQCVLAAPDVFDQDDNGIVVQLDDAPNTAAEADVRTAAEVCPALAITLLD